MEVGGRLSYYLMIIPCLKLVWDLISQYPMELILVVLVREVKDFSAMVMRYSDTTFISLEIMYYSILIHILYNVVSY